MKKNGKAPRYASIAYILLPRITSATDDAVTPQTGGYRYRCRRLLSNLPNKKPPYTTENIKNG